MSGSLDWSQYRKRRLHFILVLVATVGVMFAMGELEKYSIFAVPIGWFAWLLIAVVPLAFRFALCPCPRCGKPIHLKSGFGYPFGPRCLHCAVKVGATDESQEKK